MHALRQYGFRPWLLFLILLWAKISYTRSIILDGNLWESLYIEIPVLFILVISIEWLWQNKPRLKFSIYVILNLVLSAVFFAWIVYYQYFNTLATYTSLFDLNQTGDVGDSIAVLIDVRYYALFADLPIILGVLLIRNLRKIGMKSSDKDRIRVRNRYTAAVFVAALVFALANTLQAVGGGTVNEMMKAKNMGLLTYQAYAVYSDVKQTLVTDETLVTPRSVRAAKGIRQPNDPEWNGIAEGKDVYVIQLESVQTFVVGLKVGGREITPNLNALLEESFYFDRFYQQIGKGNTSDAEFVMNSSLYPTGNMPMSRQTAGLEVPSLPRYLDPYGYESVTLHTNDSAFWERDKMYQALGFDAYYDKDYFGEEDVVHFGASDEVLFRKSIDIFRDMKQRGTRIYANLITMTSHNPFELPEDKRMIRLPRHIEGTFVGNYLESVHYTDHTLGIWIEEMKANGLWDDAVVVIYGDHFGISDSMPQEDLDLVADIIGVPAYTKSQMFNVPLIIRVPGIEEGIVRHNMGGQIDVLPTLLNLLNVSYEDKVVFGQDLLNHEHNLIGQRTYLPGGSFINEHIIFIPGEGIDDGIVLPLEDNGQTVGPASRYAQDYHRALKLLNMSDSFVYSLPQQEAVPVIAAGESSD